MRLEIDEFRPRNSTPFLNERSPSRAVEVLLLRRRVACRGCMFSTLLKRACDRPCSSSSRLEARQVCTFPTYVICRIDYAKSLTSSRHHCELSSDINKGKKGGRVCGRCSNHCPSFTGERALSLMNDPPLRLHVDAQDRNSRAAT